MDDPSTPEAGVSDADPAATQIRQELERIRPHLEGVLPLGMHSRWNGAVTVSESLAAHARFRSDGVIEVAPYLARRRSRWRTLLHELIHSVGHPVGASEYAEAIGWEEGPVEALQRRLRVPVLTAAGVEWDEGLIRRIETLWPYEAYVEAMEEVRRIAAPADPEGFYARLLRVPLRQRAASLLREQIARGDREGARSISALSAVLSAPPPRAGGDALSREQAALLTALEADDELQDGMT